MKTLISTLSFILVISYARTATCTSIMSGNWNNPATWSCGVVPSPGDTIIIDAAHTVTLSTNTNLSGAPVVIIINGVLLFDSPSAKLRLECGSEIHINAGGSIQDSGNGTASHSIKICGIDVWTGAMGPVHGPIVIVGIPLPVELVTFTAQSEARTVDLNWITATEHNNAHFNLWASVDGTEWIYLDQIEGSGNSLALQTYSYSYTNYDNHTYFKLEQVDFDGQSTYSPVIRLQYVGADKFNVYPNPTSGDHLTIDLPESGNYTVSISSMNGTSVYSNSYFSQSRIMLNAVGLTSGIYILTVENSQSTYTTKLQVN